MIAGVATRDITAPPGEPLGGYWGRSRDGCQPCRDEISARVFFFEEAGLAAAVVALDLIGVSYTFATRLQRAARDAAVAAGRAAPSVMVAATHTHNSPQTHDAMVGFGHTSQDYMQSIVDAVAAAAREAAVSARPAAIRHMRTTPLGLSVNRRQRAVDETDAEPASKRPRGAGGKVMWFEQAGRTTLGQRPEGPRQPIADVIEVVASSPGADKAGTIGCIVCWSCHPVCCGKMAYAQSADYVYRARATVEAHTGAPALYLNGACGDVNPLERGGGYAAADRLGDALGAACVAALSRAAPIRYPDEASGVAGVETVANLPLAPLPSEAEAEHFLAEQRAWLEQARAAAAAAAAPAAADGVAWPAALPEETLAYAEGVLAASRAGGASSPPHVGCALHALRLGPVSLLGVAGEVFTEYAAHFAAASPCAATITVGFANGCVGYLPTEAEAAWGGYEVVHAHVVYGQQRRFDLGRAERSLVTSSLELLRSLGQKTAAQQAAAAARPPLAPPPLAPPKLLAEALDSHFEHAHDTYNSVGVTASGDVCYVLSSATADVGGVLFRFDGAAASEVAQLTAACGDPPRRVAQGKAHCPLLCDAEGDGATYFGTHVGWYTEVDGMETLPAVGPGGLGAYPGGCLLRLEPDGTTVTRLARLPDGEGVLTLAADFRRRRLFCLLWPSGRLCVARPAGADGGGAAGGDAWQVEVHDYPGRGGGEGVHPRTGEYRPVCRALVVDPRSGRALWSNAFGEILAYDGGGGAAGAGAVHVLLSGAEGLVRDYFGSFDPAAPGSMGYHWRQAQWCEASQTILGMHGNSGYLFELSLPAADDDGARPLLQLRARLASAPSQRCGMADQFSYGYLGFQERGGRVFYLTGAPIFGADGRRLAGKASTAKGEAKGLEHLHLVTYDLANDRYEDHGAIFYANRLGFPTYVNSLAVGTDGWLYALGRMPNGRTDLFRVRAP